MTLIQSIRNIIDNGNKNKEIIVPIDKRSITIDNSNGANVSTDVFPLLSGLRNNLVLGKAGATVITGATSNINISKFTGNTAKWKNETNSAEESDIIFDGITLTPYRLTSFITVSNEWLLQDSNGANETLKQDLLNSICEKIEETILGNEEGIDKPQGLFFGIDETTPISYNEIVSMEEELDNNNVPNFNRTFIISNSAKSILRKTKKESGGKGRYILEKQKIQSLPTLSTNSVIENGILFGDFEEMVIAVFGPVIITVDPYSNAIDGETKITINFFVDAKPRRNECFVKRIIGEGTEEPKEPEVEITGNLRGKFTDDSTSSDWWYYKNGSNLSSNKVNISEFVDPITKEFEIDLEENKNTLKYLFYNNSAIERIDEVPLGDVAISCESMFDNCSSLQSVSLPQFTGKEVTNCQNMFYKCSSLQSVSMPQFTGEEVTDYYYMFYNCSELQSVSLPQFTGENLIDCESMFNNCSSLQSVSLPQFTGKEVTNCRSMFDNCSSLQSVSMPQFTGENLIDCDYMFDNCSSLQSVSMPQFTGEKVTSCGGMFYNCSELQSVSLPQFTGKEVTNCQNMFYNCSELQSVSLPQFTGKEVTNCRSMFDNCSSLQSVSMPQFTGEKVTSFIFTFRGCSSLQSIYVNFTIGETTSTTSMFVDYTYYYPEFTTIQTTGGLKICNTITFQYCRSLTNESVMVIINALEDRSEKSTKTLTLYRNQYDELTPEQLAIATSKNWTVARS